jgi:colanic acid/amylovoran biosynthesis glycosyltransferase
MTAWGCSHVVRNESRFPSRTLGIVRPNPKTSDPAESESDHMTRTSSNRLLYLVPEFPSQTHAFFWREAQALRSNNVDVVFVSTRQPALDACRHEFARPAAAQTHYLFPPDWVSDTLFLISRPAAVFKLLKYVAGLRESNWLDRFKVALLVLPAATLCRIARDQNAMHLHVHSFANSAHVAALAHLMGGCSYSLTLHGDLEVYGKDHVSKTARAKFVTCVTEPLKRQILERIGLPETKVHVLWMGVDTRRFKPIDRPVRAPQDPLRLLTVARLHVNKGHRFALRALRKLKDQGLAARYTIVGDGPDRGAIEQEVAALDLTRDVELVGTKSETDVLNLLQQSDALLLTSVGMGEAAPVAVMEAMACGVPVVCSIIGGTRDMIRDGHDGFLVEQEDTDAIAWSIGMLIKDPELAVRMGQAARVRAEQVFDCEALAGRFRRLVVCDQTE